MPGTCNLYVFEDDGTYYVRPGVAMVSRTLDADRVTIRNLTEHAIEIRFPIGGHVPVATIPPSSTGTIPIPPGANGIYDYRVDVVLVADMAKVRAMGNSFPKIIVDP